MSGTDCPTGCGRRRARGHLMCRPCWGEVPRFLQAEVLRTWRRWSRCMSDVEAMQAYRAASDAAVAAVR